MSHVESRASCRPLDWRDVTRDYSLLVFLIVSHTTQTCSILPLQEGALLEQIVVELANVATIDQWVVL